MIVYILVVITNVSGVGVAFNSQEFNQLDKCKANASHISTIRNVIEAYCTEK